MLIFQKAERPAVMCHGRLHTWKRHEWSEVKRQLKQDKQEFNPALQETSTASHHGLSGVQEAAGRTGEGGDFAVL
jgi:hypothetical protein